MTTSVFRFSAIAVAMFALAACGGGGGGASPEVPDPVKKPSGTLTISKEECEVLPDQSECEAVLTVTTKDAAAAVVVDETGKTYPLRANRTDTLVVAAVLGQKRSFKLDYGGASMTDAAVLEAVCQGGGVVTLRADGTPACAKTLQYENIVIGDAGLAPNTRIFRGGSCAEVAEKVIWTKNATPYQVTLTNPLPLGQRGYYKTPLPSGLIPMFGAIFEKNDMREGLVLNLVTETVDVYDGSEGPLPRFGPTQDDVDSGWITVSEMSTDPAIDKFAETSAWMIYNTYESSSTVYCKDKATGVSILLPGTDNDIQYRNFTAYSWPK